MQDAVDASGPGLSDDAARTSAGPATPASPGTPGAPRTAFRTLTRRLTRTLTWAALLATAAILAAVLSGGQWRLPVVLFAALDGWAVPALAVAAAGVAVLRRLRTSVRRPAAALAALTMLTLVVLQPWPHGGTADPDAGRYSALRVTALNLEFGGADPDQVMAAVRRTRPDVLVLTELTPAAVTALHAAGLDAVLPHARVEARPSASGTGVWSRLPLTGAERLGDLTFEGVLVTLDVDGTPVTVYGVHPSPPTGLAAWQADYDRLHALVGRSVRAGEHVVLAGDLNAGTHNAPLARLMDLGLRDAGTAKQWPWQGQTWPTDLGIPRVIRIDHVLATRSVGITSIDTFEVDGTDHRGVVAQLEVPYRPTS